MLLPIINVNISNATDEQFKFTLIEDIDQIRRDQFVETCDEGVELIFHSFLNTPFSNQTRLCENLIQNKSPLSARYSLYVFLFIFIRHFDVLAIGLEIDRLDFTENVVVGGEVHVETSFFDWIFSGTW